MAEEPMAGHLGTVALSPLTRLLSLPLDGPIIPLLILYLVPTLEVNYGPFNPSDILTEKGLRSLKTLSELNGCKTVLYQFLRESILKPDWQENPAIQKYQATNINGGKAIGGPLLVIQGRDDPVIHTPTVVEAINETMDKFPNSHIEFHLLPDVTHAPAMYAGLQIYVEWIAARFAKRPVRPCYHSTIALPVRPTSAQQTEANWFVQAQTEPWQAS